LSVARYNEASRRSACNTFAGSDHKSLLLERNIMADSQPTGTGEGVQPVEYREIDGFPGYRVGSDGTIWSKRLSGGRIAREWRQMTGGFDRNGYRKVTLCNSGSQVCWRVSRIVIVAFHGPAPAGMECCHRNGDKTDDRAENLRWGTHCDNIRDKLIHGTHQIGNSHPTRKLTESQVVEIRRRWAAGGVTQFQLAAEFGVKNVTICAVVTRRNWRHV